MKARAQIRKHYKAMRDAMPPVSVNQLSAQISRYILQWEVYQRADTVFFYHPLGNEASLLPAVKDALAKEKHVAFPKVFGDAMEFYEVFGLHELEEGQFHVMEPFTDGKSPVREPSVCFVPGTVFDQSGGRFGYGRGYYDRYFAGHGSTVLVGCAYGFQIVGWLPVGSLDVGMDYLVSENGICHCKRKMKDVEEPNSVTVSSEKRR